MNDNTLTPERILEAAEDVLRRFGPTKATVVDVARALGVSHGSIYRHFPSKAALRDAVTEHWLTQISTPLADIVAADGPALERIRRWLDALIAAKRQRSLDDPELFATYIALTAEAREVVDAHVDTLVTHLARMIRDGVARGELVASEPTTTARAVVIATGFFHNPVHASQWSDPDIDAMFEGVWSLILRGLGNE